MTMLGLVVRSLVHYRRAHLGVLAATALTAAILTGALLVGDSVDHSLRSNALARLGDIHYALESRNRFVGADLPLALHDRLSDAGVSVSPAIALPGMAIVTGGNGDRPAQINQVNVIGVTASFWDFDPTASVALGGYEVALNTRLAAALDVAAGDQVSLRIMSPGLLPRDAPLSSRTEDASTRALCTVRAVLPDSGLGRFSLAAEQTPPYNAFVNLDWLREQTELTQRVNLVLVGGGVREEALDEALGASWGLADVGLRFRQDAGGSYIQLETDRLYLRPAVADAALGMPGAQGTLAYLVNGIACKGKSTPYSFAVAGPAPPGMADDEAVINRWLADHIGAAVGDEISVTYYELSPSNEFIERERSFTVHSIAEMDALAAEGELMPEFPGLSDVESCEDWDVGMPMDEDLLKDKDNEAYWNEYRQTPKLIVTLAAGQQMWGNRYGDVMTVRFPAATSTEAQLSEAVRARVAPRDVGLAFVPARRQAIDAVTQAMDLGGLFLGMSFFLIVSTLIITALLFVFGAEQRAADMGILLAVGFRPGQVRLLLLTEAAAVAILGSVLGAFVGMAYTRLLIFAVNHYWQGAVAHADILYYVAPLSVVKGFAASACCAVIAMAVTMRRQVRLPVRELLMRDFSQADAGAIEPRTPRPWLSCAALAAAVAVVVWALAADVQDVAMPFFGAGALLLVAGLGLCRFLLRRWSVGRQDRTPSLKRLGIENASRRRGRSLGVVTLLATGCFLVLAVSSMQQNIAAGAGERWSGTGGFELFAQSTIPMSDDPAKGLDMPDVSALAIRVHDGDDASCLNLNHAQTPRLLGVSVSAMSSLGAFARSPNENPWDLLNADLPEGVVPGLVGDTDTAMWGLKKKVGVDAGAEIAYQDEQGRDIRVKLVGTLPMRLSVFQGSILIGERVFTRLFPSEDGYRMFLIDTPVDGKDQVIRKLDARYDRFGLDAVDSVDRLRAFYTVETTYLSMFLVLGGLGIVLSTAALGVLVVRNLFERRREVALLRAVGFRQGNVFLLLLVEHGLLLAMGIAVGTAAALVAMAPAVTASATRVPVGLQIAVLALVILAGTVSVVAALGVGLGKDTTDALRTE